MEKYLKNIICIFAVSLLLVIVSPANKAEYVKAASQNDLIEQFSEQYGADPLIAKAVVRCESKGNHSTVGDGGHSNGVYQFMEETFNRMAKKMGEEGLDYTSEYDQLKVGTYAMAHPELAKEWTTYVAIQKGGTYSFYSKINKKHFTIHCKV